MPNPRRTCRPAIRELIELVDDIPIVIARRTRLEGQPVLGHYDGETITLGVEGHRKTGQADQLIQTVIHELIHAHNENHTEKQIKVWELQYFKNQELREAVLLRIVNVAFF